MTGWRALGSHGAGVGSGSSPYRTFRVPAVIVQSPVGEKVWLHRSRDFADRPDDSDVMTALKSLRAPPLDPPPEPWQPDVEPEEHPGAFRTDAFGS